VTLYLPQHVAEPERHSKAVPAAPLDAVAGETILVVEDNPDVRAVAVARLERIGYKVVESSTAADAIQQLTAGLAVDAVFSDVMMPGGQSGFDLALWLANNRPELAIVLASGFAEDVMPVASTGSWPVLRKPYTQTELASALQTAMSEKHAVAGRK
jgi:CheY-like chemotaxis protein